MHAGWEMTGSHLPNVTEISMKAIWQVASRRSGRFLVLCTPKTKAGETDKRVGLVWESSSLCCMMGKKSFSGNSDCEEIINNKTSSLRHLKTNRAL